MSLSSLIGKNKMDIPYQDIHKVWQEKFEKGQIRNIDLRNFWKFYVPNIFSPEPECDCLKITYDEQMSQRVLFDTLERFMYGGDPSVVFPMIKEIDSPPALCGKVFKNGDPTYGCRDCGMDPTCVLCAECFENSAHNKHRYKISTSSGGGYCDCGDREAWKMSVFCNIHIKGEVQSENQETQEILQKLPADLVERIHFVFDSVLSYAKQMLTHEDNYSLPLDLDYRDWDEYPNSKIRSLVELNDSYVTMLYNDETHTYDQVIDALMRAVHCSKRDSFAYATSIDREGRCIVRCSSFQQCTKAKELMDRPSNRSINRPLKVHVVHTYVIAHQVFASRLLSWLHDILKSAQAFRLIFNEIVTKDNCCLIESIFWSDTQMWKTARIQWHRLFISGMLMEINSKKVFARVFTKHYSKMMKDFIQDDHEHSVCVVSLAVQLFTMPTIAHMLIAEEDVLARLLNTFLSECRKNLKNGKLHLESRSRDINTFKRIQYILYDFKYLMGFKPEIWTTELRRGFLHGFSKLLELLSMMQGMDPMVRQVWQHMETEPEWESTFNLHLKLSTIIPLVIDWAASDQVVLTKAYRMLLKALGEQTTEDMKRRYIKVLCGDFSVSCIEYDVSTAPVSLHLPLSRLVAGLTLKLEKYELNFNSVEFNVSGKPSPEVLMEPVLRTQVMIAQANIGMWRRNGFSLTNQIYFYHNVRCRQEMLDRDVMLLQEAATLIDPNEFLIHLLNRFNLINWAREDYETNYIKGADEDNLRQTVALVEEFLTLILHLLSERYTVGVGEVSEEDCTKKEIIQLLCIEPMPHSVLNKALPEGVNHETGMEKVIDTVAVFKKPSPEAKGLFELKSEFYPDYNFFFYHYSKEEQSKSEVAQRARKKNAGEDLFCPPPIPPKFTKSFTLLVNILQCDVFLHIVRTVLQRVGEMKNQSVSESHLLIVLHLIGYALHEEERHVKTQDPSFKFTPKAQTCFILPFLEFLIGNPHALAHKDILKWTINRFHEVERLSISKNVKSSSAETESTASSVLTSGSSSSSANAEKKRKANLAAERKARIMSKMSSMQKKFIQKNECLFQETDSEPAAADMPSSTLMDFSAPEEFVAVGPHQTLSPLKDNFYTCILCHQENSAFPTANSEEGSSKVMVLGALVQRSTVLSRERLNVSHLLRPEVQDTLLLPLDLHWGVHVSSCGHVMHPDCWQRYFYDVLSRERRRPNRTRQMLSFDIEKNEYLCPLCESLCNTALPLLPTVTSRIHLNGHHQSSLGPQLDHLTTDYWLRSLEVTLKLKSPVEVCEAMNCQSTPESSTDTPETKKKAEEEKSKDLSESAATKALSTLISNYDDPKLEKINPQQMVKDFHEQKNFLKNMTKYRLPSLSQVIAHLGPATSSCSSEGEQMSDPSTSLSQLFVNNETVPFAQVMSHREYSRLSVEMLSGFSLAVYMHGLGVNPDSENLRIYQMVWCSTAYTIRVLEETQRNAKRALLTSVSTRLVDSLTALVNLSSYSPLCSDASIVSNTCSRLLSVLLGTCYQDEPRCLLDWDAFSMLVSLSMSIYSLHSTSEVTETRTIQDLFILRVTFFAHIVQILLCVSEDDMEVEMELDDGGVADEIPSGFRDYFTSAGNDLVDGEFLLAILNCARFYLRLPKVTLDPSKLLIYVKNQCLPFLRCCGLFFHFLTEVQVPEELKSTVWVPESEYLCLLRYIGLEPHIVHNFSTLYFHDLLQSWCRHPSMNDVLGKRKLQNTNSWWTRVNQLISLPKDYSELMNTVSQFPCHASVGDDSRTPTMCLICGKMLCSQSYCCQMELPEGTEPMVGACTFHANFCGAGVGVFLKVRECRVLLLSGRVKGCFITPPYLDQYGEADHGLKRGNPLKLDENSYSRLHNMWLSHSIPDTIAHTMENSSNVLIMEWFHH